MRTRAAGRTRRIGDSRAGVHTGAVARILPRIRHPFTPGYLLQVGFGQFPFVFATHTFFGPFSLLLPVVENLYCVFSINRRVQWVHRHVFPHGGEGTPPHLPPNRSTPPLRLVFDRWTAGVTLYGRRRRWRRDRVEVNARRRKTAGLIAAPAAARLAARRANVSPSTTSYLLQICFCQMSFVFAAHNLPCFVLVWLLHLDHPTSPDDLRLQGLKSIQSFCGGGGGLVRKW